MKKSLIYLLFAAVALSGCNKEQGPAENDNQDMSVVISMGDPSKGDDGFYNPYDQSERVLLNYASCHLISVAVDNNDNPIYDNFVESWFSIESYYGNLIIGSSKKKAADWFAHSPSGKCIFFASIQRQRLNLDYWVETYTHDGAGGTQSTNDRVLLQQVFPVDIDDDGTLDTIMPLVSISNYQSNNVGSTDYGIAYRDVENVIGACQLSPNPVSYSDIIANKNVLNLGGFAPASTLLKFNLKTTGGLADFTVNRVTVSMRSLDGTEAHSALGLAFMDFSDYNNPNADAPYKLIGAGDMALLTDDDVNIFEEVPTRIDIDEFGNETYSEYKCPYYSNGIPDIISSYYYNGRNEGFTVTSTPSEECFLISIIPQSETMASNSYLIFKAYDGSNQLVSRATRMFPTQTQAHPAGFASGNLYEFTLELAPYVESNIDPDAGGAGQYNNGGDPFQN